MRGNFQVCLALLWENEQPQLGKKRGETRFGISRKTLASWRGAKPTQTDLGDLEKGEASAILYAWFWRGIRGDDLPKGVDYALFDHAAYSGVTDAVVDLQTVLRVVKPDGDVGGVTLAAIRDQDPRVVISALSRLKSNQEHAAKVEKEALAMVDHIS